MSQPSGPNPIAVGWSVFVAQRKRRPAPHGTKTTHHDELAAVLERLQQDGVPSLLPLRPALASYRLRLESVDPDDLSRDEALAYWLNLYNAGALDLAAESFSEDRLSVLRVPGGFRRPWATIAGETLSLDAIEHGKVRRFGDPRIHGALVCGSASCPTLRYAPYDGGGLDAQLDDQFRSFLAQGGAIADRPSGALLLSRVLLWYGADFVRPKHMPTWLPASKRAVAAALQPWLEDDIARWVVDSKPHIEFQPYDWSLACAVGSRRPAESDDH